MDLRELWSSWSMMSECNMHYATINTTLIHTTRGGWGGDMPLLHHECPFDMPLLPFPHSFRWSPPPLIINWWDMPKDKKSGMPERRKCYPMYINLGAGTCKPKRERLAAFMARTWPASSLRHSETSLHLEAAMPSNGYRRLSRQAGIHEAIWLWNRPPFCSWRTEGIQRKSKNEQK